VAGLWNLSNAASRADQPVVPTSPAADVIHEDGSQTGVTADRPAGRHPGHLSVAATDVPPKRLTNDRRNEYAASVIQLHNGDLLAAYDRWQGLTPYDSSWKMLRRSTDGGNSWSAPESLLWGGMKAWPRLAQTQAGTILMFYRDWRHPPAYDTGYISYVRSTDNGFHWTQESQLPGPGFGKKYQGAVFEPTAGTLWMFYTESTLTSGYDVYRQTSTDEGNTWHGETAFVTGLGNQFFSSVFRDSTEKIWVFYRLSSNAYYYITSINNGQTWSDAQQSPWNVGGAIVDSTGKFWSAYGPTSNPRYNSDIYYRTSTDNGTTWSDSIQVTRFIGMDVTSCSAIINGVVWLFFHSDRSLNGDIWYGVLDSLSDPHPPPYMPPFYLLPQNHPNPTTNPGGPRLRRQFSPVGYCVDDSGISSVQLVFSVNGVRQPDFTLYDDGNHGDFGAGDSWYGNFLGPFDSSVTIYARFRVRDLEGDTILAPQDSWLIDVVGIHDTGNVELYIDPADGRDGDAQSRGYPSLQWPKASGNNYLFEGHAWVGVIDNGETLVSDLDPNSGHCDWKTCQGEGLRWWSGLSDWDSYIPVDDRSPYTGRPIGIEIHKRGLSWHYWRIDDFVIQEYVFMNTGQNGDLTNVYLGFCYDFDVGTASSDLVGFDGVRWLSYMYNAGGVPSGYAGVRMLSHQPRSHSWWNIDHDPTTDGAKYRLLVSDSFMSPPTTRADYRVLQSVGPFPIRAGDSLDSVVVGLVVGDGLAGLREDADAMRELYNNGYVPGVTEAGPGPAEYRFELEPAMPSLATGRTVIRYQIPAEGHVSLVVYDLSGRVARTLVDGVQKPGACSVWWDGTDARRRRLPGGVYFVRLQAGTVSLGRKVVLTD